MPDLRPEHLRPRYECSECFGGVAYSKGGRCYECQERARVRYEKWRDRQEDEFGWGFQGSAVDMF